MPRYQLLVVVIDIDHCVLYLSSLAGIFRTAPNTGVIWVVTAVFEIPNQLNANFEDAHADINVPESSPSGNIHGMPLGAHLGISDFSKFHGWGWFKQTLWPETIVFIGLRDLDPLEVIEYNSS